MAQVTPVSLFQPKPFVVIGAQGQLGREFLRVLGAQAEALDRSRLDLADAATMEQTLVAIHPDVVINTAAFNQVDLAETERSQALAANSAGPGKLAELSAIHGWRLLHFSTDYVFGGDGLNRPRVETDASAPVNFYGYSKLLGEEAVLRQCPSARVARVAHLYGGMSGSSGRANLVLRFLEQARTGQPIWITCGQILNPTSVRDLVPACLELLQSGAHGLYHLAGDGACEAREFVEEVLRIAGFTSSLHEVERDTRPARRAPYTALANQRLELESRPPLPPWRESLAAYVGELIAAPTPIPS